MRMEQHIREIERIKEKRLENERKEQEKPRAQAEIRRLEPNRREQERQRTQPEETRLEQNKREYIAQADERILERKEKKIEFQRKEYERPEEKQSSLVTVT